VPSVLCGRAQHVDGPLFLLTHVISDSAIFTKLRNEGMYIFNAKYCSSSEVKGNKMRWICGTCSTMRNAYKTLFSNVNSVASLSYLGVDEKKVLKLIGN
jgi:hypothetical protein